MEMGFSMSGSAATRFRLNSGGTTIFAPAFSGAVGPPTG